MRAMVKVMRVIEQKRQHAMESVVVTEKHSHMDQPHVPSLLYRIATPCCQITYET